ncbi:SDR family oxidoreductase, partial [Kitasatospora sp. MY 5-36]|uniref:SDR family oxidoreductase n=1 Tax=Kitasatospora sp. MY 5-36 TaxID=1678027 RepID=UPI0021015416
MADRGASRVVLTSRSGPGAAGVAELAASIAARGTAVDVVACDIADRASVAEILDRIDAAGPVLSSVVHSAGVGDRGPVEEIEPSDLSWLLSAKVGGAVVLDELTAGRDLDAFVLFSSGAGVWGSGALAGYAAANAHLDALVEDRRSRGLVAS